MWGRWGRAHALRWPRERRRHAEAYGGLPVSYESHCLPPGRISRLLEDAGLTVTATLVQEPAEGAKRLYGTFLAVRS
ncbi:hypothetical protein [Streptomyces sp. NPDC051909]|uniref:hypothetical protein n=1 Tax=Streptomyces sp. NPDC051909 TaxID=3154944 RepID=UPI003442CA50